MVYATCEPIGTTAVRGAGAGNERVAECSGFAFLGNDAVWLSYRLHPRSHYSALAVDQYSILISIMRHELQATSIAPKSRIHRREVMALIPHARCLRREALCASVSHRSSQRAQSTRHQQISTSEPGHLHIAEASQHPPCSHQFAVFRAGATPSPWANFVS